MENNMELFIYQDELGITYFDNYFDYLEKIKNLIDKPIYDFFSDWDRYSLRSDKTLHDSRLKSLFFDGNTLSILLNLKFDDQLLLVYENVKFEFSSPFFFELDLLVHELHWLEYEQIYEHILCFDKDNDLMVRFEKFSYIEIPSK